MSNHLPPYAPAAGHHTSRPYVQDLYQQSKSIRRNPQDDHLTYSSSPLRSSSPPSTPYSTRHDHAYAYIRSSPEVNSDVGLRGESEHLEDPASPWGHRYTAYSFVRYPAHFSTAPPKPAYSQSELSPSLNFDPSEYSEDLDHDILDLDSEHTSDSAPGHSSTPFSESEEEDSPDQEDPTFNFGQDGYRTTFFRTSAERGQWKNDPKPFRPASLLQSRKSAPSLSRVPTPIPSTSRTVSEPAPEALENTNFILSKKPDPSTLAIPPINASAESPTEQDVQSPHTIPSLTSDRESSPDLNEHDAPSSPLPPSSPPLSPMSISVSSTSRSLSPLSIAPSSPYLRGSSVLSELAPDDQEEAGGMPVEEGPSTDGGGVVNTRSPMTISNSLMNLPEELFTVPPPAPPSDPSIAASRNPPPEEPSIPVYDLFSDSVVVEEYGSVAANIQDVFSVNVPEGAASRVNTPSQVDISNEAAGRDGGSGKTLIPVRSSLLMEIAATSAGDLMEVDNEPSKTTDLKDEKAKSMKLKDKNGVERPTAKKAVARRASSSDLRQTSVSSSSSSRTKRKGQGSADDVPVKKRKTGSDASSSVKDTCKISATTSKQRSQSKSAGKRRIDEDDMENDASESLSVPILKGKERSREGSTSTSSKGKSKSSKRRHLSKIEFDSHNESQEQALDPETAALHAEICGMLIETMALSRASSLPVSSLYKSVMQTQPSLKAQRSEKEWMGILDEVLHKGEAACGSGVFGKVESSGKDESDRPLEAQWFYVPELDEDQERAALIKSMMPRPAKRSETKKYKQYYWRPLEKISKWDPEDEL